MTYDPSWSNGDAQGRLCYGIHSTCLSDPAELADAINRRRRLTFQNEQDFSSHLQADANVEKEPLAEGVTGSFNSFRYNIIAKILSPALGTLGGTPPTPANMQWLWPLAGADENKIIVSGLESVGQDEIGLLDQINESGNWTDSTVTGSVTPIRAVHWNELRQAIEWIHRGCWELPVYSTTGIVSVAPDTPWIGEMIANNGVDEIRSLGYIVIRTAETPTEGLTNVTVRAASRLELLAGADATVEIYRCLRPIHFAVNRPTWNEYDPDGSLAWSTSGGTGSGDAAFIGSINLSAGVAGSVSNAALISSLQAMVDGDDAVFLARRTDNAPGGTSLTATAFIEFDLDNPPN